MQEDEHEKSTSDEAASQGNLQVRKNSSDMIPLGFADKLPDSVEEDLFSLPTDEFEAKYKIRSDASDLVPSMSAFDLPVVSDSMLESMTTAANRVDSRGFERAERSARRYGSAERQVPTAEYNHITEVLEELARASMKAPVSDAEDVKRLIDELGRASSQLRERLSQIDDSYTDDSHG
jgi:hypothetical protein